MKIVMKPLSELRPAPYNPRVMLEPGDPRYRKLKRSIEHFGLVEPLLWNRQTEYLVGGHQRLRILHELQFTEVPVSVVDLPLKQEKALNVILNNREAQSDWDLTMLTRVLEELHAMPESELSATGFDAGHLKTLQSQLAPSNQTNESENKPSKYEITLCIPMVQLQEVRGELDALIDRHDLETHVRHR